jgi:hypothetical protein
MTHTHLLRAALQTVLAPQVTHAFDAGRNTLPAGQPVHVIARTSYP